MTAPLDMEAIKRRADLCTGQQEGRSAPGYPTICRTPEPGAVFYRSQAADIDAHLDRRDLIAEVERLEVEAKQLRSIAEQMLRVPAEYAGHCVLCGAHHKNEQPHDSDCPHQLATEWAAKGSRQ